MSIDVQIALAIIPPLVLFVGITVSHIEAVRAYERNRRK
jgi:hypothetical protein